MKRPGLFLCCASVLCLLACGGGSSNTMMTQQGPPALAPLNGTLSFAANSQVTSSNTFNVDGSLTVDSSGNVTGTLAVASVSATVAGACIPAGTMVSFTGMLTPQGRLTLTSPGINGQTISLAVTVSSDGNFFSSGSFTVSGGCLNGDHGTLVVNHLVGGAYSGSFMLSGNMVSATVTFGPAGIPQLDGTIPMRAAATFSNNSACGFSTAGTEGGDQTGLKIDLTMVSNSASIITFGGTSADSSAASVSGTIGITGGTCDQMSGMITLKKS